MTRATIAGVALTTVLVLLVLAVGFRALERSREPDAPYPVATTPSPLPPAAEDHQGFLYGRIGAGGGATYEGRLRWGRDEEAFWGDYFYGTKRENPWAVHVPLEQLPRERRSFEIFGIEIPRRQRPIDLRRPFMARFGDIARIEALGREVRVTLKSGTMLDLDRFEASDFDDGVRVWDRGRGVVDLGSLRIGSIELLPTAWLEEAPERLHGTVRTRLGEFTGFVQWDLRECVGSDEIYGRTADGAVSVRFDSLRAIARQSRDSALVTLLDGREIVLSGSRKVGLGDRKVPHRGIYVEDRRYGRVLVSWEAFERVDFAPGGSGPAFDDFPPGAPLTGSVTTRAGRLLAGRLVYDLDESETTETLDAPSQGVHYTIPFGLVAAIVLPGPEDRGAGTARVTLHSGEELELERRGDLGDGNAGMLIFVDGCERPRYVPWAAVERVDLDRPPAMYPPIGG
jgi:hypothetical protein